LGGIARRNRQDTSRALSSDNLCSRPGTRKRICDFSIRAARETIVRLSKTLTQERKEMRQGKYPPGWDEKKVQRVLKHYEQQTEEEAVAEDEAAFEDSTQAIMEVPRELVPTIRNLLQNTNGRVGPNLACRPGYCSHARSTAGLRSARPDVSRSHSELCGVTGDDLR
jgi:hypothetical protein